MSIDDGADSTTPVFLVVDDERDTVEALRLALDRRFGADYTVLGYQTAHDGLAVLQRLRDGGRPVAILIADLWMPDMTGLEFLVQAHRLHPDAGRAVLMRGYDRHETEQVAQAMALGSIDTWVFKPCEPVDVRLHPRVCELLTDWVLATGRPGFRPLRMVAELDSPDTHELHDVLERNDVAVDILAPDAPQGRELLAQAGQDGSRLPVAVYHTGLVQVRPSLTDIVEALGVPTRPRRPHYDLTVVGAGPAGLSAAVCSASEGLHTLLLEPRSFGGQAGSTSKIRNYLGFPRGVTGRQLASLAYDQCVLFGADPVFAQAVRLDVADGGLVLDLAGGARVTSDVVVLAVGVDYRRLAATGVDELIGKGVFYGAAVSEAPAMRGQRVFIVGAGNSAGQAAVYLAKFAHEVTLVVRGPSLATSMSDYLIKEIRATANIDVRLNTQVTAAGGRERLEHLALCDAAASRAETVAAGALFIMIGARPNTGWLADTVRCDELGFILTGADLVPDGKPPDGWTAVRPPLPMETSVPGVFAVGDVRCGSTKRVATAVGAGSIAIQFAHQFLAARGRLQ
jgi:thioredoxin reductase (NADPH)